MKKLFVTFMVALFATTVFAQHTTKTEIKPSELPQCFKDWVTQNVQDYTIEKAYKIEKKNETGTAKDPGIIVNYVAKCVKGNKFQWVVSDPGCKGIKKISAKEADEYLKQKPPVH